MCHGFAIFWFKYILESCSPEMSLPPLQEAQKNILAWGQPSGIHPLPWACFSGSALAHSHPCLDCSSSTKLSSGVTYHI